MEYKTYKPSFIVNYLYKNRKKYDEYFKNKIKNIKYNIFYGELNKNYIKYCKDQHLDISFNPWDVTNNKIKFKENKYYARKHKNGWIISGVIHKDWVHYVDVITAYHKKFGYIYGNFSEEIHVISFNPKLALEHFLDNNPPLIWTSFDI
jgi:hypothetical protein